MATPPFNPNELLPGNTDVVSQYPGVERTFRDIVESWILFEHGRSGHHAIPNLATASRDSITDWEVGSLVYNTSLGKFQSTISIDPDVWVSIGPEFPAGTRMLFQQTSVPAGWTKESNAAYENSAIRSTTGAVATGGTAAFTTVFDARTILKANLPLYNLDVTDPGHAHNDDVGTPQGADPGGAGPYLQSGLGSDTDSAVTGITVSSGGSGTAMDFDVKHVDVSVGIKS
jgi:hypothetical protein